MFRIDKMWFNKCVVRYYIIYIYINILSQLYSRGLLPGVDLCSPFIMFCDLCSKTMLSLFLVKSSYRITNGDLAQFFHVVTVYMSGYLSCLCTCIVMKKNFLLVPSPSIQYPVPQDPWHMHVFHYSRTKVQHATGW